MAGLRTTAMWDVEALCPCRGALASHPSTSGRQFLAPQGSETLAPNSLLGMSLRWPCSQTLLPIGVLPLPPPPAGQLSRTPRVGHPSCSNIDSLSSVFSFSSSSTHLALLHSAASSPRPFLRWHSRHLSSVSAVTTDARPYNSTPAGKASKPVGTLEPRDQEGPPRSSTERVRAVKAGSPKGPGEAEAQNGFSPLGLSPALLERLEAAGLATATDVQVAAIPVLLQGHDAALQSYTGSGKTLAYLLPVLSNIGPLAETNESLPDGERGGKAGQGIQAVIVAPSRELAMQIVREAERILGPENKKAVQQLIGGANQQRQEEALKKLKPTIVIGTPGRISDLSRAGRLQTHGCRWLVLDEADALLSQKFRAEMLRILEHVGLRRSAAATGGSATSKRTERQTVLVSATMPPAVLEAATRWGHRPLLVRASGVGPLAGPTGAQRTEPAGEAQGGTKAGIEGIRESLPPNLDHRYIVAPQRHKVDVVRKCIHAQNAKSVIVFMNYGRRLKDTEFKLGARSIAAGNLHGGMDKVARANVLSAFREGKLRVLVVSEVAARGLDVLECDLVVNLEMPTDGAHYAHRAGRTGRLGRGGTVITICEEPQEFVVDKFARQLGIRISRAEVVEGQVVPYEGRMRY